MSNGAEVLGPIGPLADHARAYAQAGLAVFPCHPFTKAPLTQNGLYDATTDVAQVERWWRDFPDALIGHRVPAGVLIVDIDPRHGGRVVWDALRKLYPVGATRRHMSGRGDGGGHLWFELPPGKLTTRKLLAWAIEQGLAMPMRDEHDIIIPGKFHLGIDLLHHGFRYTILPPSPHPSTGLPYRWVGEGATAPILAMPDEIAALLIDEPRERPAPTQRPLSVDGDSIADWFSATRSWHEVIGVHSWVVTKGDGDSDGSAWQHPQATSQQSATITDGRLYVYTPNTIFEVTEPGDPRGYSRFEAFAALDHRGDLKAAASAARKLRNRLEGRGQQSGDDIFEALGAPGFEASPVPDRASGTDDEPDRSGPPNLPREFWESRPELAHIRQAAHARTRSADAVLGATLARLAVTVSPAVRLPAPVGTSGTLDLVVALVGRSGTGKSSAAKVAAELLPIADPSIAVVPLGSGEGLIEAFFDWVDEVGDDGKRRRVKKQTRQAVLALLDEGQALAEMAGRHGSTIMPVIRSAWSGDHLGQANASEERKRHLQPGSYRFAMVAGFQTEHAVALLADSAGGTPQRFVYFAAEDAAVPDRAPEWPGDLALPRVHYLALTLDEQVADEIRARALSRTRGQVEIDALDAHRDLGRLKLAGLLAALAGRAHIDSDDWRLAGMIVDSSDRVRASILTAARLAAQDAEKAMSGKLARRALDVDEALQHRALKSMSRSIARHVHRDACGGCNRRCAQQATSGKHRKLVTFDEAADEAAGQGWIIVADGHLRPGPELP